MLMAGKFGETEGFFGAKIGRNHSEIFLRSLTKTSGY